MLIKIAVNAAARRDVLDIASIFRARAIDVSDHTITLEVNLFLFIHLSGFILKNAVIRNMVQNYMSIPSTKPKNNIGVYAEILSINNYSISFGWIQFVIFFNLSFEAD